MLEMYSTTTVRSKVSQWHPRLYEHLLDAVHGCSTFTVEQIFLAQIIFEQTGEVGTLWDVDLVGAFEAKHFKTVQQCYENITEGLNLLPSNGPSLFCDFFTCFCLRRVEPQKNLGSKGIFAVLFNPFDPEDIGKVIDSIYINEAEIETLNRHSMQRNEIDLSNIISAKDSPIMKFFRSIKRWIG